MHLIDEVVKHRNQILKCAKDHGIHNIRLFGSCLYRQETENSDIDLLIDIDKDRSLMDLSGFKNQMEDLFNRKVDVIIEGSLHWYIRPHILNEARPI